MTVHYPTWQVRSIGAEESPTPHKSHDSSNKFMATGRYGVTAEDLPFLEVPFLFPIPCPHCSSLDFAPAPVNKHSKVRCYRDEKDLSTFHKWTGSPVRIGDSFEKLQVSKMW